MASNPPRILVVDDDPEIRKLLARYIESQGFRVLLASNCQELRDRLATQQIDLMILDVMLPDGSGLDVCRDLRAKRSTVPIILLTALKEDVDRIIGLEIGADDYLGKPFNPRELIARVRAVLRRRAEATPAASEERFYQFEGFMLGLDADLGIAAAGPALACAVPLVGDNRACCRGHFGVRRKSHGQASRPARECRRLGRGGRRLA